MDNGWVPTRKNQDFLLSVLLQTELLNYDIVVISGTQKVEQFRYKVMYLLSLGTIQGQE